MFKHVYALHFLHLEWLLCDGQYLINGQTDIQTQRATAIKQVNVKRVFSTISTMTDNGNMSHLYSRDRASSWP